MYSEGLPLVGNVVAFMRDPLGLVRRGHAARGGVFTIRIAHKRMTFLLGAAPHAAFFRATDEQLDQTEVYRFSVPVFGRGVVYDAPLPVRLQQFRLLSLSLRVNMLETYVPMMVGECVAFFDAWADDGEVELFEALSQLIILTASRCLMGRGGGGAPFRGRHAADTPRVSGRLPELFDNPDVWDPERFAPGREEDRRAPFS
eukprot:contig_38145_g8936